MPSSHSSPTENRRSAGSACSWPTFVFAVTLAFVAGCSSDDRTATVSGEVTLDSLPLSDGVIRFVPADGQSPTASASIVGGRFVAEVPVGHQRVEISAPKIIGKRKMYDSPDCPVVDEVAELIPARYNVRTQLTILIEKGKQNKRFELLGQ